MNKSALNSSEFVETPLGVFTVNGNWYYTNSDEIGKFAPGLLTQTSFGELLGEAETWVRSTDSMSILVLMVLLQMMPGYAAAILSVLFLISWHLTKSAMVSKTTTQVVKLITWEPLVIIVAVASISYMGISGYYADVVYGLLFFIVFRFGWFRKVFDSFYERYNEQISLNDRVLKMVVLRSAMRNSVPIKEVSVMENTIKELMRKRKSPRKR